MKKPPLERYSDKLVEFAHELTPLRLDAREQAILRQFQTGHRTGLGMNAWGARGLLRMIWLSGLVVTWKTLCFERQFTGVYGPSLRKAMPWFNGYTHFIAQCDPLLRQYIQFGGAKPGMTVLHDEFWRMMVFNPNESDLEHARQHLNNVIYYDFERTPDWLIVDTQQALKQRQGTATFAITLERGTRDPHPTEPQDPPEYRPADESSDDSE